MFNMPAGEKSKMAKETTVYILHVQVENKIYTGTGKMICKTIFVMFLTPGVDFIRKSF